MVSGYEIGIALKGGEALKQLQPDHPMREVYRLHHANFTKRENWDWAMYDQTAVLYAARGVGDEADAYWQLVANGTVEFDGDCTTWNSQLDSGHAHLKPKMDVQRLADLIEDLMVEAPKK